MVILMPDWLANIIDKENLQDNLTFVSIYIAVYEHVTDYVVSSIKSLLCDLSIKDGKECWTETPIYQKEIRQRIVDEKGNKDVTKASFLWLVDNEVISTADYSKFLEIKSLRNKYAHELITIVFEGVEDSDIKLLFDLCEMLQRISRWFLVNIEAPIMGYDLSTDKDTNNIQSMGCVVFSLMLDVLYNDKSDEYKKIVAKIRAN